MSWWVNFDSLAEILPGFALAEVTLRAAQPEEIADACAALAREHYLGAPRPCNRELVQLALRGERVLGVLVWTRAARKLAGREAWVGWDARTRTRRLPLVVQNNRFLLLTRERQPNLASRVLGLAVAALPAQWAARTGTTPMLAETFVDPERYAGTCYKAAGWIESGPTAGFGRHGDDYYVAHAQPKRLWLRALASDASARLRDPLTPLAGEKPRAFGQLPVPAATATSLAAVLRQVADPRARAGRQFPLHAMLAGAVLAFASGARTVSDLFRFVQELTGPQRRALGFRGAADNPRRVPPPGEGCWRKVLAAVAPIAITRAVLAWQLAQTRLPPLLALDGKTLHRGLATIGPILKVYADKAGIVLTNADGDQPGVVMNLLRFVKSIGCRPLLAGNIKGLQDRFRNPTTQAGFAAKYNQKPKLITAFADGTKISMEMAITANATGFRVNTRGMHGPKCAHVTEALKLFTMDHFAQGGIVDYVLGAEPGPGVFVIGHNDHPIKRGYMNYFKMGEGPLYMFYVPYHLPHLEAPLTAARAVLFADAAVAPLGGPVCDVITMAKRDLRAGETLDGIGAYMTYGTIENSPICQRDRLLPMGLSESCVLKRDIAVDAALTYEDVIVPAGRLADRLRAEQGSYFAR